MNLLKKKLTIEFIIYEYFWILTWSYFIPLQNEPCPIFVGPKLG